MGRPFKIAASWGLPPLRKHWATINRQKREQKARERAERKVRDKRRQKCRCEAYPWPHGGLCRWPEPPLERWKPKYDWKYRPYRERYLGLRRQIARANGWHPIKDRAKIEALMSRLMVLAKQVKEKCSKVKYRNMEITEKGLTGCWRSAGADWERGE